MSDPDLPTSDLSPVADAGAGDFGLGVAPRLERLRKRWQFLAAANGLRAARGAVLIQILPRGEADPTPGAIGVGFTATRKIGGAVVRNRAKRRLREAARMLLPLHGRPGHDYVFVARAGTPGREWGRLLDDVKTALISLAAGRGDPPPGPRPARAKPAQSKGAKTSPPASRKTAPGAPAGADASPPPPR